jgi:hypothetical protein
MECRGELGDVAQHLALLRSRDWKVGHQILVNDDLERGSARLSKRVDRRFRQLLGHALDVVARVADLGQVDEVQDEEQVA